MAAVMAVAVAGCGSGSSSSTGGSSNGSGRSKTGPESGRAPEAPAAGEAEGSGGASGGRSGGQSSAQHYRPDRSLQTFGTEVSGARRSEVAHAVRAFFRALAQPDYARVCAGTTKKNLETVRLLQKARHEPVQSCVAYLPGFLPPPGPDVKRATRATITHIRIKGRDSIVFFLPPGGRGSYIPMTREGGRWGSVTLAPGTPVIPQIVRP